MALLPWRKGKVIRIENETAVTKRYWIEVPELTAFDFIPGQFVTLDLPIHEKANKRWRSYSIASWPDGTNVFELIIVLDKKGAGTNYIFEEVTVGSELIFRGAQGVFTLKEPLDKDLFLICTGTGIAPFRSMVQHIKNKNIPHKNITLIFGCRRKDTILYYNEMKELTASLPGFNYIPTLSREEWEGRTGYVHPVYEELCSDKKPAAFMLCGWRGMIDEAKQRILDMGYDAKDIHVEIYG
ncbi:MAG: oxidoreductase [Chitinophagaceae bacterium]|nr:oxidoreductase [Chitinophagaceae bacterium]MBK8784918.1 oxidoreductase [Chitinophagaceae bacterium]MBK9484116.1 oxidoreductase [Chitinophagaceae bacterium]MBL0198719.1 oxidoreductase [Chitinophagaceae bacterium]